MKDYVSQLPNKLSTVVKGPESVSAGYRQLLCIARVLLRKSKLVIMDEVLINAFVFGMKCIVLLELKLSLGFRPPLRWTRRLTGPSSSFSASTSEIPPSSVRTLPIVFSFFK